jgi:hypothetical protein
MTAHRAAMSQQLRVNQNIGGVPINTTPRQRLVPQPGVQGK